MVPVLNKNLSCFRLSECFSQNKDELIFRFIKDETDTEFITVAHLTPGFSCLAFPEEFNKARKNTVQIFKSAFNYKVLNVKGFINERAFAIELENNKSIVFKLFGNQSNIILFQDNNVESLFKHNLKLDNSCKYNQFDRIIDQSDQFIRENLDNLATVYPTLGKPLLTLLNKEIQSSDNKDKVALVKDFIRRLEYPSGYFIIKASNSMKISLLPAGNIIEKYSKPDVALTQFFRVYLGNRNFLKSKEMLLKNRQQQLIRSQSYISKTRTKLNNLTESSGYQQKADLIMANLHNINPNSTSVEFDDFFSGEKRNIKLNPRLNAQQNAEKYYRKAKNVGIEQSRLKRVIELKEAIISILSEEIITIECATEFSDIREFLKKEKKKSKIVEIPFKVFDVDGFTVWVGKNAKQNDLLTLKYAKKDDLFFHAKDVSGSHVILKQQSGKPFPKSTLEKVAALAAYYSKKKTDSLCPVGYTEKKYVRKPKGSPAGLVTVEREKVLLIKPELPN